MARKKTTTVEDEIHGCQVQTGNSTRSDSNLIEKNGIPHRSYRAMNFSNFQWKKTTGG
jgi:hypothetical protein